VPAREVFGLVLALVAQPDARERDPVAFSLRGGASHAFETSPKGRGLGDVAISRGHAGALVDVAAGGDPRTRAGLSFDTEVSEYDFSRGGEPVDELFVHRLGTRYTTPVSGAATLFVGGGVASSFEPGAEFSESLSYRLFPAALFEAADGFEIGPGFVFRTEFEDDPFTIPIVPFRWTIDDRWRVGVLDEPRLEVEYRASETLTLSLEGGYERRLYRLDDDGLAPEGAFRDSSVPVGAGAVWRPLSPIEIRADVGLHVWRFLEFLDADDGDEIVDFEADPAAFLALEVVVRF